MSVTLRPVDRHNLDALLKLKVAKEQDEYVATNAESMAQAAVMPELTPRIAYDGDTPVGFVMWTLHDERTTSAGFTACSWTRVASGAATGAR